MTDEVLNPEAEDAILRDMFGLCSNAEAKGKTVFQPHSSIPDVFVHTETGDHYTARCNNEGHTIYEIKRKAVEGTAPAP